MGIQSRGHYEAIQAREEIKNVNAVNSSVFFRNRARGDATWQPFRFRLVGCSMKPKRLALAALLLAVAIGMGLWLGRPSRPQMEQAERTGGNKPNGSAGLPVPVRSAVELALKSAASALATARTAEQREQALVQLRQAVVSGATDEIAAAMGKFLDEKGDAATGQGFKIGGGGQLLEAPTLRTWLLDQWGTIDPETAAAYARVILRQPESPDEWAIAMRNLARGDASAAGRALLEVKTGELLRNESWQQNPSIGYLEAFDTAVHLGGTSLLPALADLVRKKDNPAVAHAAFLTLDRLVIDRPVDTLAALAQHPEWMQGREETRANYFARADVSDAAQRRLLEAYLQDPARTPVELRAFAGVFPNANFMVSQNLLTTSVTIDGATLRRRDQAALEAINEWLNDPRFAAWRESLLKLRDRLN
jgi:hypothetical protein